MQHLTLKNKSKPTACLLWIGVDEIISEVLGNSECIFLLVDIGILDRLIAPVAPPCAADCCIFQ